MQPIVSSYPKSRIKSRLLRKFMHTSTSVGQVEGVRIKKFEIFGVNMGENFYSPNVTRKIRFFWKTDEVKLLIKKMGKQIEVVKYDVFRNRIN